MTVRRQWDQARMKCDDEGRCRVCSAFPVDAAHTYGRTLDERITEALPVDGGKLVIKYVHPLAVVPLCRDCHRAYDEHRLDLSPYLSFDEMAWVVSRVGIERARNRFTGKKEAPSAA